MKSGTLSATHNGTELGELTSRLRVEGGDSFCWMCELHNEDDAVRIEAVHDDGP